jgi:serine/threonine-protein kinase RsbW
MIAVPQPDDLPREPKRAMHLLPAELSSLPIIGERLHAFATDAAGPVGEAKEVHDLRLAVQEACTNLINHGWIASDKRRLAVRFELMGNLLSVYITDQGEAFDPRGEDVTPAGVSPAEGGYGLALIRSLVDELHYEATESGNTLVLGKRLPPGDET